MSYRPALLNVTPLAVTKIKDMIASRGKPTAAIRIGVRTKGCSGLSYTLEYTDTIEPKDQVVENGDVKIVVDPKAVLFLIGSTMDFKEADFSSGFFFTNPNEKGRCGCGSSFHV